MLFTCLRYIYLFVVKNVSKQLQEKGSQRFPAENRNSDLHVKHIADIHYNPRSPQTKYWVSFHNLFDLATNQESLRLPTIVWCWYREKIQRKTAMINLYPVILSMFIFPNLDCTIMFFCRNLVYYGKLMFYSTIYNVLQTLSVGSSCTPFLCELDSTLHMCVFMYIYKLYLSLHSQCVLHVSP